MTHKIYVVTDLGPGDGGKGGVVHKLCTMVRPHTVIKRGGAQGSHGVRTADGRSTSFSQWGCGTMAGIATHLSSQMVISPENLLGEAATLRYELGVNDPFGMLTVDERVVCSTPFHGIASRIKELARGDRPRGTVGTGAGQAYRAYRQSPDSAILAGDLTSPGLRDRLAAARQAIRNELQPVIDGDFLPSDRPMLNEQVELLNDDGFLEFVVSQFTEAASQLHIVGSDFLGDRLHSRQGVAVVETSHGVLTDRLAGFHPHTSAIRTLPRFTHSMLRGAGFDGRIVNLGVSRAYANRHGAGPMPTDDPQLAERLLPDRAADDNRYQGRMRVGALDFVLMRYAVEACGGPSAFDGLAITCFDHVRQDGAWQLCERYANADDPGFFTPSGAIRFRSDDGSSASESEQLEYQAALGRQLLNCSPVTRSLPIDKDAGNDVHYGICADSLQQSVGIAVRMMSFGPTELHKLCK